MGYTLNRVTLFALIFSIGILVDDAIVVVENIERHLKENIKDGIVKATLRAVSEVGNPTILATFTVIAAILPMAFVRGLMGPYMAPIPVGASFAMLLSLFVAFIVTPWAAVKLLKPHAHENGEETKHEVSKLDKLYEKVMQSLLGAKKSSLKFATLTIALLLISMGFVYTKIVKVKMLPFDDKEEFQVLVDYNSTTTLLQSRELSKALARRILENKEVKAVQIFAGEPAPFSFSGMVKHTFLRGADYQNDLQVVLTNKNDRKSSSHEIIESLRPSISEFGKENAAITKVLEIPPGPPVLATMIAEIYGPDHASRTKVANEIHQIFAKEPSVVDLDTTLRPQRPRLFFEYDQAQGGLYGTRSQEIMTLGRLMFSENTMTSLSDVSTPEEISVDLSLQQDARASTNPFLNLRVPSFESGSVEARQVLRPAIENPFLML
jgi:multidrug efflux pump subunit AcrB